MPLVQVTRDGFLKTLSSVAGIVERRHTLPILSNVMIEGRGGELAFTATDLEIQIKAKLKDVSLERDFSFTTSAKKLLDILKSLPEGSNVSLDQLDNKISVRSGKSKFQLQTLPAQDFPAFPDIGSAIGSFSVPKETFRILLSRVQFAMAQQDIRYYLNGMLLVLGDGKVKAVATDGHRLSYAEETMPGLGDLQSELILPRKTIVEILRLLNEGGESLEIEIGKSQIKAVLGELSIHSKIVEGKFPDYTKVIPGSYENRFTVDRVALMQSLQRVAILSNEKFRGVRLVLTKDSVCVISSNSEQEEAKEELDISYDGDPIDIGFNVTYLVDVLGHLNCEQIECSFGDSNSSGVFTIPGDTSFKYVVMPMRI